MFWVTSNLNFIVHLDKVSFEKKKACLVINKTAFLTDLHFSPLHYKAGPLASDLHTPEENWKSSTGGKYISAISVWTEGIRKGRDSCRHIFTCLNADTDHFLLTGSGYEKLREAPGSTRLW